MATVVMDVNEEIQAEQGAMVAMSDGVKASVTSGGGVGRAVGRRILAQESLFLTRFRAVEHGAWVSLAPSLPGDVRAVPVSEEGLVIQSGSFLAASGGVDIDTKWGGARRILGREGAFVVKVSGAGDTIIAAYGGLQRIELAAGQRITVDTGHFVASSADMEYQLGILDNVVTSALSKEGLVSRFEGPGVVYVQTRSPVELRSWIFPDRPHNS